jgi:hypothetical protein
MFQWTYRRPPALMVLQKKLPLLLRTRQLGQFMSKVLFRACVAAMTKFLKDRDIVNRNSNLSVVTRLLT